MLGTTYDRLLAVRTLSLTALCGALAWFIDHLAREPATPSIGAWPLVPIAGSVAMVVITQSPRVASELRAIESLGRSPTHARIGAIVAVALASSIAAVATARADADLLYPAATTTSRWSASAPSVGNAALADHAPIFVSTTRAVGVDRFGTFFATSAPVPLARSAPLDRRTERFAAAIAVGLSGIALAIFLAASSGASTLTRALSVGGWGVGQVVVFDLAGAGVVALPMVALPPIVLLAGAAFAQVAGATLRRPRVER